MGLHTIIRTMFRLNRSDVIVGQIKHDAEEHARETTKMIIETNRMIVKTQTYFFGKAMGVITHGH